MKKIKFTAFSDFHYKKGMYSTTVADLVAVIDRAKASDSEFILHGGDMCNDYTGSPELINTYLGSNLPVYGVYGNHELETSTNTMDKVTPLLTNDDSVVWGTADGKIGDGFTAYYHKDIGDFRIVATDTNYSFNPESGEWEHNTRGSYGPPAGSLYGNSLGPVQFAWLENLLISSAKEGKKCIVVSHASYLGEISNGTPDWVAVDQLFQRVNAMKKGTVIMAMNGHYHTNRMFEKNNIVYLDVNTTRNCWWQIQKEPHYTEGQGQMVEKVDENGNIIGTKWQEYTDLWMHPNTWFCEDALSAVVTVCENGEITIEGTESRWAYDLVPERAHDVCEPRISSKTFKLDLE